MIKKTFIGILITCIPGMLLAQSHLKSEANGPVQFNTSGNDLQLQDNGNPVTLKFKNSTTDPGTTLKLNPNGNFIVNQKNNKNILFKTNGQENMRITPGGHIGIGLSNPSSMLSVNGVIESTNGGYVFPDGSMQTKAGVLNGDSHLELTDYIKLGNNSMYITGSTFAGEYELYVTDDDLFIQSNVLSLNYNTILNSNGNTGNVGIGTTNPTAKLEVKIEGANHAEAGVRVTAPAFFPGATITDPTIFEVKREKPTVPTSYWPYFKVDLDGNVGVGTATPDYRLHVHNPSTNAGTAIRADAVNGHIRLFETDGSDVNDFTQIERNVDAFHIVHRENSTGQYTKVMASTMNGNIGFGASPNVDVKTLIENEEKTVGLCINNTQSTNFGYGVKCIVNNNTTKSLAVVNNTDNLDVFRVMGDGVVWCTELNVDVKGDFPDYVFDDNYDLLPLDDLKTFIQTEKHLPKVPTATEVAENGIAVSKMAVIQTEKIEELTLYILQLNDTVKQLQERIVELESK
jgi:hypothetical protein